MNREGETVAAEGVTPDNDMWTLLYRPGGGQHCLRLLVNGGEREEACGFDIPDRTEIGFAGGLKPGEGRYYLYGLVTPRIEVMRAESHDEERATEVTTAVLPGARTNEGGALRSFVLVRPPIDDVAALVGLDRAGYVVQRIPLLGPSTNPGRRPPSR